LFLPAKLVLLKYDAYPYQRFGLYESIIDRVDQSILNPQDMKSLPIRMEEGFYRVIVTLQQQTVTVYGKPYPLTAGMLFDAVILGEKRNIWQWIIDPIYSLKGSFKS
jgi:membrane fusion protein